MTGLARLLAENGYEQLTMRDIASAAGLARNTLYNYAADKQTLLATAAARAGSALFSEVENLATGSDSASKKLERIIAAVLQWFANDPYRHIMVKALFSAVPSSVQHEASGPMLELLQHVGGVVASGIALGEFRRLENPAMTVGLMGGVMQPAVRRVADDPTLLDAASREVSTFILGALGAASGR